MKKWEQLQLTLDKAIISIKHKFVQDEKSSSYRMWFFYKFCLEGTSDWFLECFLQVFVWSLIFLIFKLSRVNLCLWISKFFSSNLSNILQK